MNLFDVYSIYPIEIIKAKYSELWDKDGQKYLDLYGGHAVISVGHTHPYYKEKLIEQINKIGFYSNSIIIKEQQILAEKLIELSGLKNHKLFLCNSGAEANENALKLASFHNGRKKIIAMKNSFHGRTSLAVSITDDVKISAEINKNHDVIFYDLNNHDEIINQIDENTCAIIFEGIQGVGGIHIPARELLIKSKEKCERVGAIFIMDEIQSGYGRTGNFFSFQDSELVPDIITMAKGMGNGFPLAGLLISDKIETKKGLLGTTFGGNHLACAAGIAVLEIIKKENLIENSKKLGKYFFEQLRLIKDIKEIRGKGLMIGIEFDFDIKNLRDNLLYKHRIFTGFSGKNTLRILPALNIKKEEIDLFIQALKTELN